MPNETNPTIAEAKAVAVKHRKRGAIILTFTSQNWGAASYGMTRKDCDGMRGVVEQIAGLIESGVIELPPEFGYDFNTELERGWDPQQPAALAACRELVAAFAEPTDAGHHERVGKAMQMAEKAVAEVDGE